MKHEPVDGTLWRSFKQGDWESYTRLYDGHYRALNNYGHKFTKDVSLIEDSIHDLFVKLWNNRATLGTPVSVKNYLYKALRNILFRKIKWHSRFTNITDDEDPSFDVELSHDRTLIVKEEELELRQMIQRALHELPARQREIVFLRFYEGLSYEEIAEVMSINITSVYKLWYKVLEKLKSSLAHLGTIVSCLFFRVLAQAASTVEDSQRC
jgi:RNA polymerase sigma factor (sigma-70 family)